MPQTDRFIALALAEVRMLERLRDMRPGEEKALSAGAANAVREYREAYAVAHETGAPKVQRAKRKGSRA